MSDIPTNREEWLKERLKGIGASDAAAIVGESPYMSTTDLWEIKTGRKASNDISDKPYVQYGNNAEKHLRELFALDFPQYKVSYNEFKLVKNKEHPFIFATLDGELEDVINGRKGVLEIKTTEILNSGMWDKWNERIPDNYYIQVLHQLLATDYDFAILKAQIKWRKNDELNITTRHYHIERALVLDDIEYLEKEEIKFWEYVAEDNRPPVQLPTI